MSEDLMMLASREMEKRRISQYGFIENVTVLADSPTGNLTAVHATPTVAIPT